MPTAVLDWSQCPAVESIPGKRSGAWVFRDTRTPVSVVFDNLEVGASINEIMEWFHLSHEQVVASIARNCFWMTLGSTLTTELNSSMAVFSSSVFPSSIGA